MTNKSDTSPINHFFQPTFESIPTETQDKHLTSAFKCKCTPLYPDRLFVIQHELSCLLSNPELNVGLSHIIEFVYNPFVYAGNIHLTFLKKYINTPKKLVFLGMNPGPWGMMQTGVSHRLLNYFIIGYKLSEWFCTRFNTY